MKVCIAGTGAITAPNRYLVEKSDFTLESFYYFKEWQIPIIKGSKLFLLDSGAFTFMNSCKEQVDFDEYLERYIAFINKYDVTYFFELDIDSVVGYEKVKELRRKLERGTGKKCIPVWHKSRGLDEWKKLCQEYDYVAIGGIVTREITKKEYKFFKPLLKFARENSCKVHGLGFTNLKELSSYDFYSVDSTSWKSGNRFGSLYQFKDNELLLIKKPAGKKVKSGEYYGLVEKHNYLEWIKFQKYADAYL